MNNTFLPKKTRCCNIIPKTKLKLSKRLYTKYFSNITTYRKLFVTQLLTPSTLTHAKYKENLITFDTKEFLKKYYYINEAFQKVHLLSMVNFFLIKPSPNFLGMQAMYNLMQRNLNEKQRLLNIYLNIAKRIREDIVTDQHDLHFLHKYSDSLSKIFETQKTIINDFSKQFKTDFYIDPHDNDGDSVLVIENLIKCINNAQRPMLVEKNQQTQITSIKDKAIGNNSKRDRNVRVGAVSTLMKKCITNEDGFPVIQRTINHSKTKTEHKKVKLFEQHECMLLPKRKQSEIITKESALLNKKLKQIFIGTNSNNSRNSINIKSRNVGDDTTQQYKTMFNTFHVSSSDNNSFLEKRNNNKRFLKSKVFINRLKEKKHKQLTQHTLLMNPLLRTYINESSLKTSNNNHSVFTHSKECLTERSFKNRTITNAEHTFHMNSTTCNKQSVKHKQHIKGNSSGNKFRTISTYSYRCNSEHPTKLVLSKGDNSSRMYLKTSIFHNETLINSTTCHKRHNLTSTNITNCFQTISHCSDNIKDTKRTFQQSIGLNNHNNKRHVTNFAFFLRKDSS